MRLVQLVVRDLKEEDIPRIINMAGDELNCASDVPFIVHKSATKTMVLVNQYIDSEDDIDIHHAMVSVGRVIGCVDKLAVSKSWSVHRLSRIEENSARNHWSVRDEEA